MTTFNPEDIAPSVSPPHPQNRSAVLIYCLHILTNSFKSIKRESSLISRTIAGCLQGDSRLSSGMDRRKLVRSKISEAQRLVLEREYAIERMPSRAHRGDIAEETGLSQKTVRLWFQNQRQRRASGGVATAKMSLTPESILDIADAGDGESLLPDGETVPPTEITLDDFLSPGGDALFLAPAAAGGAITSPPALLPQGGDVTPFPDGAPLPFAPFPPFFPLASDAVVQVGPPSAFREFALAMSNQSLAQAMIWRNIAGQN